MMQGGAWLVLFLVVLVAGEISVCVRSGTLVNGRLKNSCCDSKWRMDLCHAGQLTHFNKCIPPPPLPEPLPEPEPFPEPEPLPEPEPEPLQEPEPEPEPLPGPEPQKEPEPEPQPHPAPHPKPQPQPAPKQPEPAPEPEDPTFLGFDVKKVVIPVSIGIVVLIIALIIGGIYWWKKRNENKSVFIDLGDLPDRRVGSTLLYPTGNDSGNDTSCSDEDAPLIQ